MLRLSLKTKWLLLRLLLRFVIPPFLLQFLLFNIALALLPKLLVSAPTQAPALWLTLQRPVFLLVPPLPLV